jgi:hypothetical protein
MKELINKTISKILVNDDQSILIFETNEGDVIYETDADCCSETWFADITGVDALIGTTVTESEEVKMSEVKDGRTRQEYDSFYGIKLKTDKGYASIVYRNSSNGYYGGDIKFRDNKRESIFVNKPVQLTEITSDWSA